MNIPPSQPSNQPDEAAEAALAALVERARQGDEDAFGEIVRSQYNRVYGVMRRMVNNVDDARELTQMAWVKAWQRLGTFEGQSKFTTWLYRLSVNTALDHLRARARRKETVYLDEVGADETLQHEANLTVAPSTERAVDGDEIRDAFHKALESLSPDHRQALMLREVDGLSYKEIAKICGCRMGTVMSRIFYARRAIQDKLKEWR